MAPGCGTQPLLPWFLCDAEPGEQQQRAPEHGIEPGTEQPLPPSETAVLAPVQLRPASAQHGRAAGHQRYRAAGKGTQNPISLSDQVLKAESPPLD